MIVVRSFSTFKPLKESVFREESKKALQRLEKNVLDDFRRTTKTWKRQPKFTSKIVVDRAQIALFVGTDDKIYGYVDKGTKPHIIRAKTKKGLIFLTGGTPKTTPNVIQAFPSKPGTKWNRKMQVKNPGTKARNFTAIITKTLNKEFQNEMRLAMERFARRSK